MTTRGAELLSRIIAAVGTDAVGAAVGVLGRVVARWVEGLEIPSVNHQAALEGCYNLPTWAWYAPAESGGYALPPPPPPPTGAASEVSGPQAESLDLLNAQLRRVAQDIDAVRGNTLGGVNYAELSRLEKLYTSIVEKRAIVSGQLKAIEENRLARTETFRAFVRKAVESLREFPEARDAVIRAFGGDTEGGA